MGEGRQAPRQEKMGALTAALCSPLAQPRGKGGGRLQVPKGPRKGRRMATEAGRPPEGGRGQTRVSFLPRVEGCPTEPAAAPSGVWVFGCLAEAAGREPCRGGCSAV